MLENKLLQLCPVNRRIDKVFVWEQEEGVASELWRQPVIACALYIERDGDDDDADDTFRTRYVGLLDAHPEERGIDTDSIADDGDMFLGLEFDGEQRDWKDKIARFLKKCQDERDENAHEDAIVAAILPHLKEQAMEIVAPCPLMNAAFGHVWKAGSTHSVTNEKIQDATVRAFILKTAQGEYRPEVSSISFKSLQPGCPFNDRMIGTAEALEEWRATHPPEPRGKGPGVGTEWVHNCS